MKIPVLFLLSAIVTLVLYLSLASPANDVPVAAQVRSANAASSAEPTAQSSALLITTIKRRNQAIHIYSGQRYTVEDDQTGQCFALISEAEFQQQFPELYRDLQTMYAPMNLDASSRRGPVIITSGPSEGSFQWAQSAAN